MTLLNPNRPIARPSVDMNVGDTYGPMQGEATIPEVLGASFRQNNLIGSGLHQRAGRNPLERDEGFDVYAYNKGTRFEARNDLFVDYYNKEAADVLREQIDMEDRDRATLSRATFLGDLLDMAVSVGDPTILLPGGAILRGAKGGYSALRTAGSVGLAAAGGVAAQEAGLQATQATRPLSQSVIAIGAGGLIGSALGAGIGGFMARKEFSRIVSQLDKDMGDAGGRPLPVDVNDKAMRDALDEARGNLSAAESLDTLDDLTFAGRGARAIAAIGDWAKLNPMLRLFTSPDPMVRSIADNLIENSAYLRKNLEGKASAQAVETFIKEATQGMAREAIVATRSIYDELIKSGQHIKLRDFNERIGRAMRRGDMDDSGGPIADAVSRAAKEWRTKVFDPLKDAATGKKDLYGNFKVNLLPEDVSVKTADSYFTRLYNVPKIEQQEGRFREIARAWTQSETDKAVARMKERRDRRVASIEQRIGDMQLSGRERANTMRMLTEQLKLLRETNPQLTKIASDIGKLQRKALKAARDGDMATEAQARADIEALRSHGDVPYANFRAQERALTGRINTIRNNIVGRGDQIERARAQQAQIEAANIEVLHRLKRQLETVQEKIDRADPEEHEETLAAVREELLDTVLKSEEAADKIEKLSGRAADVEASEQLSEAGKRVMDDITEQLWTMGFDGPTVNAYARYFAERYEARAGASGLGEDAWQAYQRTGGVAIRNDEAPLPGQLGEREFAQGDNFDQLFVNLSASTSSIGGLDALTKAAQGTGAKAKQAARLLNEIAYDSLSHLLGGTKAQVDYTPSAGLYFGDYEPSLGLDIRFAPEDRPAVLAALAKFAVNFNQAEVHVRAASEGDVPRGTVHPDGAMETVVYEWPLKKPLSRQAIQKIIDESKLPGLTFSDKAVTAYYAGKPNDEAAIHAFLDASGRAGAAGLGEGSARAGRLYRYGDVDGAIPYERIAGELRPGSSAEGRRTSQRIASRIAGFDVKPARGEPTITTEKRALQERIAAAYERMPLDDLSNPIVRHAYKRLAKEVKRQYEALPIKVEVWAAKNKETGAWEPKKNEPYSEPRASDRMRADVDDNNHLYVFATDVDNFGPPGVRYDNHPLLAQTGIEDINGYPMTYNDLLRAVHDYYAHTMAPNSFGPIGEEAAWLNHMRMTTDPWARWALTSETRGQNSWVNFRPGAENMTQKQRGFAEQKVGLLPLEFVRTGDETLDRQLDAVLRRIPAQAKKYATPAEISEAAAPSMRELIDNVAGFKAVARYLAPDEQIKLSKRQAKKLLDIFERLPDPEEMAAVAFSGRAKRGWYDRSAKALVEIFGVTDAPRFAALLAALSPQNSVQTNAANALRVWTAWNKERRPTNERDLLRIIGANVEGTGTEASILDAWRNNSVLALTHPDPGSPGFSLSGPKVHSFMNNLLRRVDEVTNDAWMANYSNIDQKLFASSYVKVSDVEPKKLGTKSIGYMAMSAAVRRAAELLSKRTGQPWTPAEIQETIWSWSKALYEKRDAAGGDATMADILKAGGLTHQEIADVPDFERLFTSQTIDDGIYRRILEEGGYGEGLARAEEGSEGVVRGDDFGGAITEGAGSGLGQSAFERHLRRAAGRLEQLREDRIAAGKTGGEDVVDELAEGGADAPLTTREALEAERDRLFNEPDTDANRQRLEEIEQQLDNLLDDDGGFDLMQSSVQKHDEDLRIGREARATLERLGVDPALNYDELSSAVVDRLIEDASAVGYRKRGDAPGSTARMYLAHLRRQAKRAWEDDAADHLGRPRRVFAQSARQVDTPEFKQWFGASKIVDKAGNPVRVYHGTISDFDAFDPSRAGQATGHSSAQLGIFFTRSPLVTEMFMPRDWTRWGSGEPPFLGGSNVMPAYLRIENPKVLTGGEFDRMFIRGDGPAAVAYRAQLEAEGHDGIIVRAKRRPESKRDEFAAEQYIVFKPTQIKSAIGNRGTFDPADPNILAQGGDRGMISFRGERPIINLFKNRDLSTLLHESGHLWLEELKVDAALPTAPQRLKDDLGIVLNYLGVDDVTKIGRAEHEKFARAMEAYLRKGEAPSNALAVVFQRFKEWLTNIYKSITELNAPVSKELKGVLDRLLATEEKIATKGENAEVLKARAEREGKTDARRQERIDYLGNRLDRLEQLDPEQQIVELQQMLEERIARAAKTVERGGARIQQLSDRIDNLDPEIARKQVSDLQARRDEVTSDYHQRVNVDMGDGYVDDIVDSIFSQITGRMSSAVPHNIVPTARGPLKERTWNIPDHLIEDYLENDIELVGRRYARIMAAETELAAKFGSADMKDQIKAIHESYRRRVAAVERSTKLDAREKEKMLTRLSAREKADVRDINALRDILRGTYQSAENAQGWARVLHGANTFNYIRTMGGVTLSSLTDAARPMMVHGLGRYLLDGIGPLLGNLKGIGKMRAEGELAGTIGEKEMLHRVAALADLTDPYSRRHPVEGMLDNLATTMSKLNLLAWWTDWQKSIATRMTMNRLLKNVGNYAELKPKEAAYMRYLGIGEGEAAMIKAEYDRVGEQMGGLRIPNTEQWEDISARRILRAALNKDVDSIIVTPGAADIPLFARTPHGRALLQFKSFALASNQRVLMRGLQEGPTKMLTGLVGMTTMGMALTWLKAYEANRQDKLSDNPGFWIAEGLDRSGIFSIMFEASNTMEKWGAPGLKTAATALFPQASQKGPATRYASRSDVATLLGPTADMGDTLVRLLRGIGDGDVTESDINSLRRLLPFSTLPGIRSLLEYGILPTVKEAVR